MRRRVGAFVALAALLALVLGYPVHEYSHAASLRAAVNAATATHAGELRWQIQSERSRDPGAHDPSLCPICRSGNPARLALRVPAQVLTLEPGGTSLALALPDPLAATPDPWLRGRPPRAPPASLLVPGV